MTQHLMKVSNLPVFLTNALQQEDYIVHDHAHIVDPEALTKVTALVGTGSESKVDKKLLSMLPNVKLIALCGVGYDGIEMDAIQARGIVVTHTPGTMTADVADLALGLMLAVGRRIPQADHFLRNGDWVMEPFAMTRRVSGKRMGILGLGRIGRAIAKRAEAFDMSVAYCGRAPKADVSYAFHADVASLAEAVDFLVVATPGGAQTKHLVNADVLQKLGPKGFLINIARASVVDQAALVQALKDKTIAGAGLDVFWDEPRVPAELRSFSNVVLTPHIGSHTEETRRDMADLTMANLRAFYAQDDLPTPVPECRPDVGMT
ncbi:LdhA Lactate dehydrogenase and related dehydrogenases [Burkholderiaceae bacterium]